MNRQEHHRRRLERAVTDREALWAACAWLAAEAVRTGRAGWATRAVLDLLRALPDTPPADPSPTPTHPA